MAKVTPINCANCGSPVPVEEYAPVVTCDHCQTAMTIAWPQRQRRVYIAGGGGSPFVICPVCRCQQIRRDDQPDREIECPQCGSQAHMPPQAENEFRICQVCGRAYDSRL